MYAYGFDFLPAFVERSILRYLDAGAATTADEGGGGDDDAGGDVGLGVSGVIAGGDGGNGSAEEDDEEAYEEAEDAQDAVDLERGGASGVDFGDDDEDARWLMESPPDDWCDNW